MNTKRMIFFRFSRNYILIAIALLISLYGLFMAPTVPVRLYTIGLLVVLIPFLEMHNQEAICQLCLVFFVCIQVSSLALFDRLPYELLLGSQPLGSAFCYGLPAALACCILAQLILQRQAEPIKLYGIKFPLMILACTWYMRMALILINCQHFPEAKAISIPAVVIQKCPAYGDQHELWIRYTFEGDEHETLFEVHPRLHRQAVTGSRLTLQLHVGVYGWPWYHKDIKRRYQ